MKNLYFIFLMIIFVGVTAWLIWSYWRYDRSNTASTQTILDLTVNGGTLGGNIIPGTDGTTEVELEEVFLNGSNQTASGNINTQVKDHRASAVGWTQTLSCSDFVSGTNTITADNLTINPLNINALGESDLSGVFLGPIYTLADSSDQAVIMNALPGSGFGRYEAESELSLFIDSLTSPGSYNANVTITIF
jgi:hypothetical protein